MFLSKIACTILLFSIFLCIQTKPTIQSTVKSNPILKNSICEKYITEASPTTMLTSVPLLLSFPGSGNTWMRLLIEKLTGRKTSSLHPDDTLNIIFKSQNACDKSLAAIKAHPYGILPDLNTSFFKLRYKQLVERCRLGGLELFDKVIFLSRDPVVSAWAEFHLALSGSHVGNFKLFPEDRFLKWREFAISFTKQIQLEWDTLLYPFIKNNPDKIIIIKFENLINPSLRNEEVKKMCKFLPCNPSNLTERIDCAFVLSDVPEIHRKPDVNITHDPSLPVNYLPITFSKMPTLSCDIYKIASNIYSNFSYLAFGKANCTI
jgi:hypothetical protein